MGGDKDSLKYEFAIIEFAQIVSKNLIDKFGIDDGVHYLKTQTSFTIEHLKSKIEITTETLRSQDDGTELEYPTQEFE